jgi:predicted permease
MTVCLSVKVLLTLVRSWTNLVTLASAVENISFVALTCD